jgi:hypothetical protein
MIAFSYQRSVISLRSPRRSRGKTPPPYSPDPVSGGVAPAWAVVSPAGVCSNM